MARHTGLFFCVALLGAGLDLLTKHLAFKHISGTFEEVPVIEGFFHIGRTVNPGIIFGGWGNAPMLWLVVSVVAVPAILWIFWSVRKPKRILTICLGMILAGTIGNMYDRVFTGAHAVRDFIKFFYVSAEGVPKIWPLFNLADSFICVGVFLLSFEMLFFDERARRREPHAPPAPPPSTAAPLAAPGTVVEGK